MSRHEPAPTRHYISSVLFVGACGRSSQEPGHALTSVRHSVTCEVCRGLLPAETDRQAWRRLADGRLRDAFPEVRL